MAQGMNCWSHIQSLFYPKLPSVSIFKSGLIHRYSKLCQLIDAVNLCHFTLEYPCCMVILGIIYTQIGIATATFEEQDVIKNFCHSSLHLIDEKFVLNKTFRAFLLRKVGVPLEEVLPFIRYTSRFFGLKAELKLHKACKYEDNTEVSIRCSFLWNLRNHMRLSCPFKTGTSSPSITSCRTFTANFEH